MKKFIFLILLLLFTVPAGADSEHTIGGKTAAAHIIQDEGTSLRPRPYLNFTGSVECTDSGGKTVCNVTGGGAGGAGNTFLTWSVPNGTNPVADSTTDTVTFTESGFITITGTAASDTINIGAAAELADLTDVNQATFTAGNFLVADGTDWESVVITGDVTFNGSGISTIGADKVALGTDTTGGYAASTTEGGGATSLETDAVDAITEIASALKTGSDSKVATGTAGSTGEIAEWDANGDIIDSNVIFGTLTDGRYCKYTTSGTLLDCNVTCADITGSADLCDGNDASGGGASSGTTVKINGSVSSTSTMDFVDASTIVWNLASSTATASVSNDSITSVHLDSTNTRGELETVLILSNMQGNVTDSQVPNNITIDLATTATTANAGDSATAFFSSGTIERERGGLETDVSAYDGLIGITGGSTYNQTGTTTQIIIFDGAGAPTSAAISGDATMTNAGVLSIASNAVGTTEINLAMDPTWTGDHDFSGATVVFANSSLEIEYINATGRTPSNFLRGDGTWNSPSGSGDITDVFSCSSGDCSSITVADGDLLNFSGVTVSSATEGIILPQAGNCETLGTAEGQLCWDTDNDQLWIGNGSTVTHITTNGGAGGGGATLFEFNLPSVKLNTTHAIIGDSTQSAVLDGSAGTWMILFDATTDEGVSWEATIPDNYSSGLTIKVMYSMASATSGTVEYEATVMCVSDADSQDLDLNGFGTTAVGSATVPGTAGYPDVISITADDSCASGDLIILNLSTDADDGTNDTATGDREVRRVWAAYTGS